MATGLNVYKTSAGFVTGPPKGVNVFKMCAGLVTGPLSGVNVFKMSAAFVTGPKGGAVFNLSPAAILRIPRGGDVFKEAVGAVLRIPRGGAVFKATVGLYLNTPTLQFRAYNVQKYATLEYNIQARARIVRAYASLAVSASQGRVFALESYAAMSPAMARARKANAYISIQREHAARAMSTAAYVSLVESTIRLRKLQKYASLKEVRNTARISQSTAYVSMFGTPPIRVIQFTALASLKVGQPIPIKKVSAYAAMKAPAVFVKQLRKYAAFLKGDASIYKIRKYVAIKPRPPTMFTRKITAHAAIKRPPPVRTYSALKMVTLAPPPPRARVKTAAKFASIQGPPPTKVQMTRGYATLKPPPPVFAHKLVAYAALLPRPISLITFSITSHVSLAGLPPRLRKTNSYAALIPLGSIGVRVKAAPSYVVLSPGTPVAVTQYPIVNVS